MTRTTTAIDGVELAYEVHGAGGAVGGAVGSVVLVHGWGGHRRYWDEEVPRLATDHQVVTLDLGGHGESGSGRADWSLPAFGDDVVAVVDAVGADRVAIVGHSMGGDAAVYAAARLGDRVAGVVWVDAFRSLGEEPVSPPEAVDAFLAPWRLDFAASVDRFARGLFPDTADPVLVDRVADDMAAFPRDVALGSLRYVLDREPALLAARSRVAAPIVAINPDLGPTDVDSLRRHGVEPVVVPGVGHYVMLEAPERFHEQLVEALASFG